jgi:hypothetical protein
VNDTAKIVDFSAVSKVQNASPQQFRARKYESDMKADQ